MLFLNSLFAISTVPGKSAIFITMPLLILEAYLIEVCDNELGISLIGVFPP